MTSRELTFGVDFWWVVISAWPWCIFPYNLMQDIFLQSKVINIFFEIQDGGRRHLGFSVYVNLAIPALLTVCYLCSVPNLVQKSVLVTEIDTHASDLNLMTSRELTSGFDFWSRGRRRGASFHIIWCKIYLSSPKLLTFFRNSIWRPPPSWIFTLCEFGHSGVLIGQHLCSVPNLVQISVIVTEIDAHMLQTFIWWRHAN